MRQAVSNRAGGYLLQYDNEQQSSLLLILTTTQRVEVYVTLHAAKVKSLSTDACMKILSYSLVANSTTESARGRLNRRGVHNEETEG